MKNLVIKYSEKYKSLGVFSDKDYSKGDSVNTYDTSKTVGLDYYNNLPVSEKWKYYYDKHKGIVYELDEITSRINHSCDPNIASNRNGSDIAIRDIKNGEEITAWYMNYKKNGIKCLCGSKKCLGEISF